MSFLIDTNVISELRKGMQCDANVARWFDSIDAAEIYLSALVLGEVRRGIERVRRKDIDKARQLEAWLADVRESFSDRILPVDETVADEWGRMTAGRSVPTTGALLAATAKVHGMTLATRNIADVADLGAEILNPFAPTAR